MTASSSAVRRNSGESDIVIVRWCSSPWSRCLCVACSSSTRYGWPIKFQAIMRPFTEKPQAKGVIRSLAMTLMFQRCMPPHKTSGVRMVSSLSRVIFHDCCTHIPFSSANNITKLVMSSTSFASLLGKANVGYRNSAPSSPSTKPLPPSAKTVKQHA